MTKFQRIRVLAGVSSFALCLAAGLSAAQAQGFTVSSGTTVTTTQEIIGDGETGKVEAGGAIEIISDFDNAINASDNNATVINDGTILTNGVDADGINATGDNSVVTNSGTILTGDDESDAIRSSGDNNTITNKGSISTLGQNSYGIDSIGDAAFIRNEGSISTAFENTDGIYSEGDNATITNSGSITTLGIAASGIFSDVSDNAKITNSGTISTSGESARAIAVFGGSNITVTNSGTLSTTGLDGSGILVSGAVDVSIINTGEILTSNDDARGIVSGSTDNANIINSGKVATQGANAYGIFSSGDDALITNEGEISTAGTDAYAINSFGDDAVIANKGEISTTNVSSHGIASVGARGDVANTGEITTGGANAHGVYARGDDTKVTNSGSIAASGTGASAIYSEIGDNMVITNNGQLSTSGQFTSAILSDGINASITNNGEISTLHHNAIGIRADGDGAAVVNNGKVSTVGAGSDAVYLEGENSSFTNTGTISATDAFGVFSLRANSVITNSGTIYGGNFALGINGANSTVRLLQGSVLEGDLNFQEGDTATLEIGPGLSAVLSFNVGGGNEMPATITASGMPLVVDTVAGTVMTADVTALRAQGEMLGDLTGGIFSAIGGRRNGGTATAPLAYAPVSAAASITDIYRSGDVPTREAWLKGFGGYRSNDGTSTSGENDQALAGLVSGIDLFSSEVGVAGIFVGGAWGEVDVPHSQNIEAASGFGGVYGTFGVGTATLDVALAAGFSNYDSERQVNNNLAPGGIETAEADYDGWFVSPHLALTQPFTIGGHVVEARASVRYAGLFLDGYDETGSSANLSVDDRDVHLLVGRAGLGLPIDYTHDNGALTRITPQIGIEGRAQFGDADASGSLAGVAIDFSADGEDAVGGYAGVLVEHQAGENLTLFMETEGLIEEDAGRFFGKAGARLRF